MNYLKADSKDEAGTMKTDGRGRIDEGQGVTDDEGGTEKLFDYI